MPQLRRAVYAALLGISGVMISIPESREFIQETGIKAMSFGIKSVQEMKPRAEQAIGNLMVAYTDTVVGPINQEMVPFKHHAKNCAAAMQLAASDGMEMVRVLYRMVQHHQGFVGGYVGQDAAFVLLVIGLPTAVVIMALLLRWLSVAMAWIRKQALALMAWVQYVVDLILWPFL